jgi:hypothetical protein
VLALVVLLLELAQAVLVALVALNLLLVLAPASCRKARPMSRLFNSC